MGLPNALSHELTGVWLLLWWVSVGLCSGDPQQEVTKNTETFWYAFASADPVLGALS